ncbi:11492_t:CDS:2, partial [Funneliformis geosporum]
ESLERELKLARINRPTLPTTTNNYETKLDYFQTALYALLIYLYYQKQNPLANFTNPDSATPQEIEEVKKVNQIFADFCKNEIGGQDINEIRTKLNGRTLTEILEENEDYETKTDELTRKKGELEAEITSLTTAYKNRVNEKERLLTRLQAEKKELQTKYNKKAESLDGEQCENNKLVEKITSLEEKVKELNRTNLEESKTVDELATKLQT